MPYSQAREMASYYDSVKRLYIYRAFLSLSTVLISFGRHHPRVPLVTAMAVWINEGARPSCKVRGRLDQSTVPLAHFIAFMLQPQPH